MDLYMGDEVSPWMTVATWFYVTHLYVEIITLELFISKPM
jgi:hypothetical protein